MTKNTAKKPARMAPSKRLAAMAPKPRKSSKPRAKVLPEATSIEDVKASVTIDGVAKEMKLVTVERPTVMKVRSKFLVVDKQEVPVVVSGALETRFHVKLQAAYEARSILNGLATEQGNPDNRIFGAGVPDAAIAMVIESKAIADTFRSGRAFLVDFTEVVG